MSTEDIKNKKLLIIGAGFLQTFVIKKAKELGYYTLTVDGNPHAEGFEFADEYKCIDIVDEEACLNYALEKRVDGVMTAATDYGVLSASYISEQMGIPGLNYKSAKLIKNKYLVRKRLFEYHVDDSEQTYEVTPDTDIYTLSKKLEYPVMVKPCDGSGSRGASRVDYPDSLAKACEYAMNGSVSHKAEIESFINGREYGAESLVINGEVHVLAIMKKWMTEPPYYAELGHAIPCGLSNEIEKRVREIVKKAIFALGINHGSVNMDLLITESGNIHIVDIGARMGGNLIGSHIVNKGTGIDYLANLIRATVGDDVDLTPITKKNKVVTRLLALHPGKIVSIPDIQKIKQKFDVEIYHHMHIGDMIDEYHTNLDGFGYVVSTDDNFEIAEKKAVSAFEELDCSIVRER